MCLKEGFLDGEIFATQNLFALSITSINYTLKGIELLSSYLYLNGPRANYM